MINQILKKFLKLLPFILMPVATWYFLSRMAPAFDDTPSQSVEDSTPSIDSPMACTPVANYHDYVLPQGLKGYFDLEEAVACAKAQGKPLLVSFMGHGCINCKKMEEIWNEHSTRERLQDNFVLVTLMVDDGTELEAPYTSEFNGQDITTIGQHNLALQEKLTRTNEQPYFLILDHQGKDLIQPIGYTPEVSTFNQFLDKGKRAFAY